MTGNIPVGTIMMYAGDISASTITGLVEQGWLLCDGSKYPRTILMFRTLFLTIGESYGGDDSNFCVPMCNGLFLRGVTGESVNDPDTLARVPPRPDRPNAGNKGNSIGSMQSHEIQSHTHGYNVYNDLHDCDHVAGHDTLNSGSTSITMGGAGTSETRPANMYVNFIIKYLASDSTIPVGAVIPYAGALPDSTIDPSWLACNGDGLDQVQYSALYNVIENFYGENGNIFFLPDYRGRFVRGWQGTPINGVPVYDPDAATRTAPTSQPVPGNNGNQVGSLESGALMLHQHSYTYNDSYQFTAATGPWGTFDGVAYADGTTGYNSDISGGSETRPLNMSVNYLIKVV
ncbi:MAG: hypothetical protein JWQ98_14 [Chlorobi bacterium]|nr:hypothetical protein [Chlorobiota bacterium]